MRALLLGALALLAVACGSHPPSSLAECSLDVACTDAAETCWASQACGPPELGRPVSCREATGDFKCHRTCATDSGCAPEERCSEEDFFDRSDTGTSIRICR
jgi:hypothetical protein